MIYRYTGPGYYPGVPARDLSEHDLAALDERQQADVRSGHAYRAEEEPEPAAEPAESPSGEFAVEPPAEDAPVVPHG